MLEYFEDFPTLLDDNVPVDAMYLDYQKAFDTVPIKRLLAKLEAVRIKGKVFDWIKAFLIGREQRVCVRGTYSNWHKVLSGVPQGSILGPVLFFIYINDIVMNIDSTIKLFMADVKVYRAIKNPDDSNCLQNDFNQLAAWSKKLLIQFNAN